MCSIPMCCSLLGGTGFSSLMLTHHQLFLSSPVSKHLDLFTYSGHVALLYAAARKQNVISQESLPYQMLAADLIVRRHPSMQR